jgi:chorismate mutase
MELNKLRWEIDIIDKQIINLLAQRFDIVKKISKYKKENNMEALQPERWNKLLKEKIKLWEKNKLNNNFIKDVWNRIHKESLKLEEKEIKSNS